MVDDTSAMPWARIDELEAENVELKKKAMKWQDAERRCAEHAYTIYQFTQTIRRVRDRIETVRKNKHAPTAKHWGREHAVDEILQIMDEEFGCG